MLLYGRKAAVLRRYPFTITLKPRTDGDLQPIELKADPGSKVTGVALFADYAKRGKAVVWAMDRFNVSTTASVVQGISYKYRSVLHRADGYSYLSKTGAPVGFEKPSIRAKEIS